MTSRPSGRQPGQLRDITLETGVTRYAEGSCLAKFGHTHVLCTASVEDRVPPWMRGQNRGWVTAEYGMLPRATHTRGNREAARGKQSGRTQEIQRLIGRSLRSVTDLSAMPDVQVTLDCDVIQADGGTRTAAITGAWVALRLALDHLKREGVIHHDPLRRHAAAVSVGLFADTAVLDLDYDEDSGGQADMNVVMSSDGGFIEVQGTGEERPMTRGEMNDLLGLAEKGCTELFEAQKAAVAAAAAS